MGITFNCRCDWASVRGASSKHINRDRPRINRFLLNVLLLCFFCFVSGHEFTRAVSFSEMSLALAPAKDLLLEDFSADFARDVVKQNALQNISHNFPGLSKHL